MVSSGADIGGDDGLRRRVGLGVIADSLINIGRTIAAQRAT